ncbi:hypothetical protein GE061_011290 [Apolygus lucorum]|uniref:Uncharacterized protein n=1 Tax=Apolygus lucorum TaxID=248454 RepID=A0A6A4K491_APOLU|nr:hypothetical protein GE061_011290 [Apolygus lucorum]
MSHILTRRTTCLDFSRVTSNDTYHLTSSLPNFHSYLTGPLKKNDQLHELACGGGKLEFNDYKSFSTRPCPTVSLSGRRTVTGAMNLCGISYTLNSCQFTARANQTEVLKSFGNINGVVERVEIKFVVYSVGLRYFCRLNVPRLIMNFAYFPPNFFNNESKTVDGINKLYFREGTMEAINSLLSHSIARLLSKRNECTDFFRISRH